MPFSSSVKAIPRKSGVALSRCGIVAAAAAMLMAQSPTHGQCGPSQLDEWPNPRPNFTSQLGTSIALDQFLEGASDTDVSLVGAPGEGLPNGPNSGAAWMFFGRNGFGIRLQESKLAPWDGAPGDAFGTAVAVSGDTAIVGAPMRDHAGVADSGSVYVFTGVTSRAPLQRVRLDASDPQALSGFGGAVDVSGNTIVVGAQGADGKGAVYVFVGSGATWTQQAKLTAADGATGDGFGRSVSIDGDTLVVGAPSDNTTAGADAGSAYVFVRTGSSWSQQSKLTAGDAGPGHGLGRSLSVLFDTVICGAPTAAGSGAAYVFVRSGTTWTQQARITAPDAASGDNFGFSVCLDGVTAAIGAYLKTTAAGIGAGRTYTYIRAGSDWTHQQSLDASGSAQNEFMGFSIAIKQDLLVAGAPNHQGPHSAFAGRACAFRRMGTTWTETSSLRAMDTPAFDRFGTSLAMSGNRVVISSPDASADNGYAWSAGRVYVRSWTGSAWVTEAEIKDPAYYDAGNFGAAVAIDGDSIVVGAPAAGTLEPCARVFARNGVAWSQQGYLAAPFGQPDDGFGSAVAIESIRVAVGAPLADTTFGADAGLVYLFAYSGSAWYQQTVFIGSGLQPGDRFGANVAMSGGRVFVSAPGDDTAQGADAGSVHVYATTGPPMFLWFREATLEAPDGAPGDEFGASLAAHGNYLVVGAPSANTSDGADAGRVYIFSRTSGSWAVEANRAASDGAGGDRFGQSVAIHGTMVLVGASGDDTSLGGPDAGSAYAYQRNTVSGIWQRIGTRKLTASDAASGDRFGSAVAVSGYTGVVGAPARDTLGGDDAGTGYVFNLYQCRVDMDGSGAANPADVSIFVNLWSASLGVGSIEGDFDGDGLVIPADVAAFVSAWFAEL